MSQRWLKLLERIGAPLRRRPKLRDPLKLPETERDSWHGFRHYDVLFQLYGPPKDSPWYPYHCPTLFAAIDRLNLFPRPMAISDEAAAPAPAGAWRWLRANTMVLLDLPGGLSVQMGARLLVEQGVQLVSTFDHWPCANPRSPVEPFDYRNLEPRPWPSENVQRSVAIDSSDVIDSMVTLAPRLHARMLRGIAPDAPPVWLCDSRRMAAVRPGPGDFDNRYFIDDSILPSPERVSRHGIDRLVYFSYHPERPPSDDLASFLCQCHRLGITLLNVALTETSTWVEPRVMAPPPEVKLSAWTFPKSQIGGFGRKIPQPSESSGGSFSGAGG